jgi:hypothetical protein
VAVIKSIWNSRLFSVPDRDRKWYEILLWWELRRIPFNMIVGTAGILSLALFGLFDSLPPVSPDFQDADIGLSVLVFGLLANVCYFFGWLCELITKSHFERRNKPPGPILLGIGLLFWVALTTIVPLGAATQWIGRFLNR